MRGPSCGVASKRSCPAWNRGSDPFCLRAADVVTEIQVEAVFEDGSRLAVVSDPFGVGGPGDLAPGAVLPGPAAAGPEPVLLLTVRNTAPVPISVTSHFHFFEVNPRLSFDRAAAYGMRLAVPAGASARFDAGRAVEVGLVRWGSAGGDRLRRSRRRPPRRPRSQGGGHAPGRRPWVPGCRRGTRARRSPVHLRRLRRRGRRRRTGRRGHPDGDPQQPAQPQPQPRYVRADADGRDVRGVRRVQGHLVRRRLRAGHHRRPRGRHITLPRTGRGPRPDAPRDGQRRLRQGRPTAVPHPHRSTTAGGVRWT